MPANVADLKGPLKAVGRLMEALRGYWRKYEGYWRQYGGY